MCHGCWVGYGRPAIMDDAVREAARLIGAVYDESIVGGALHIVIDDWNLEVSSLGFCRKEAKTPAELACLNALGNMHIRRRASALALHDGFINDQGVARDGGAPTPDPWNNAEGLIDYAAWMRANPMPPPHLVEVDFADFEQPDMFEPDPAPWTPEWNEDRRQRMIMESTPYLAGSAYFGPAPCESFAGVFESMNPPFGERIVPISIAHVDIPFPPLDAPAWPTPGSYMHRVQAFGRYRRPMTAVQIIDQFEEIKPTFEGLRRAIERRIHDLARPLFTFGAQEIYDYLSSLRRPIGAVSIDTIGPTGTFNVMMDGGLSDEEQAALDDMTPLIFDVVVWPSWSARLADFSNRVDAFERRWRAGRA